MTYIPGDIPSDSESGGNKNILGVRFFFRPMTLFASFVIDCCILSACLCITWFRPTSLTLAWPCSARNPGQKVTICNYLIITRFLISHKHSFSWLFFLLHSPAFALRVLLFLVTTSEWWRFTSDWTSPWRHWNTTERARGRGHRETSIV